MLLKTDFVGAKQVLILDSEGLFSIEKGNQTYDKNLVKFCFAVSNFVLINMRGEIDSNVQNILNEATNAFVQISEHSPNPKLPKTMVIVRDQTQDDGSAAAVIKDQCTKIKQGLAEAEKQQEHGVQSIKLLDLEPSNAAKSIKLITCAIRVQPVYSKVQ